MASHAWQQVHDRHELVQRLLDEVGRCGPDRAVARYVEEIEAQFGTLEQFLLFVEHRWRLRVETAMDQAIEPGHPVESAGEASTLHTDSTHRLERLILALRDHPAPSDPGPRRLSVPV